LLITAACSLNKAKPEQEEFLPEDIVEMRQDQIDLAQIQIDSIEMRSISNNLKVSGIVITTPQHSATVSVPMGGYIKSTSLMTGSPVSKGQVLAVLENTEFIDLQQNYLEAKNRLEYAEAEYKRHNELYKDDVYSQKNVQQVTADYKSLKAAVKAMEQKLSMIGIDYKMLDEDKISNSVAIVSPISGFVRTANVNLGKYVAPSDVIFEIVNSDNLLLELTLFEKDAAKVGRNQHIRFFINNEAEEHAAQVYQTDHSIGADKTFRVFANVLGQCKNILPGMYVNAIVEGAGSKVTAVPSEAIVNFDDKDFIFVFERNKMEEGKPFKEYRMIPVQKGNSDSGFTEIILPEGLNRDDLLVVVKGAYNLLSAKKNAGEMAC
jgi:cobalt-zinc-cadmium efflux system membrane fusion protein